MEGVHWFPRLLCRNAGKDCGLAFISRHPRNMWKGGVKRDECGCNRVNGEQPKADNDGFEIMLKKHSETHQAHAVHLHGVLRELLRH